MGSCGEWQTLQNPSMDPPLFAVVSPAYIALLQFGLPKLSWVSVDKIPKFRTPMKVLS